MPIRAFSLLANLPFASPSFKKKVQTMQAGSKKIDEMLGIFEFFITGDWHYENKNIYSVLAKMSPEEREDFFCDVRQIDF